MVQASPTTSNEQRRLDMFARSVSMKLKPNMAADFKRTLEQEIIPLLRTRNGFRDELVLVAPNSTEAVGISLWDSKENAEAYQKDTYPEVQKHLSKVIDGTPKVQTYEVTAPRSTRSLLAKERSEAALPLGWGGQPRRQLIDARKELVGECEDQHLPAET